MKITVNIELQPVVSKELKHKVTLETGMQSTISVSSLKPFPATVACGLVPDIGIKKKSFTPLAVSLFRQLA